MTWLHEHRWDVAFVLILAGLIVFFEIRGAQRDAADRRETVAGCERGNVIRDYLAFDNDLRIGRLEQQLRNPAQITRADQRDFADELEARYERREALVAFPCRSLR